MCVLPKCWYIPLVWKHIFNQKTILQHLSFQRPHGSAHWPNNFDHKKYVCSIFIQCIKLVVFCIISMVPTFSGAHVLQNINKCVRCWINIQQGHIFVDTNIIKENWLCRQNFWTIQLVKTRKLTTTQGSAVKTIH